VIVPAKTSLSMQRANIGVLFALVDENGTPLGDVVIDWAKVPQLIDKLTEWQTESKPKHHVLVCDSAAFGVAPSPL
jgi:hypothetical protein